MQPVAISGKSAGPRNRENKPKPLQSVATGCLRSSMIRVVSIRPPSAKEGVAFLGPQREVGKRTMAGKTRSTLARQLVCRISGTGRGVEQVSGTRRCSVELEAVELRLWKLEEDLVIRRLGPVDLLPVSAVGVNDQNSRRAVAPRALANRAHTAVVDLRASERAEPVPDSSVQPAGASRRTKESPVGPWILRARPGSSVARGAPPQGQGRPSQSRPSRSGHGSSRLGRPAARAPRFSLPGSAIGPRAVQRSVDDVVVAVDVLGRLRGE